MLDGGSFRKNHSNFSIHLFKNTLVQSLDNMIFLQPSDLELEFSKLSFAERLILNDKNPFKMYFPGYKASRRLPGAPSVIKNRKVI